VSKSFEMNSLCFLNCYIMCVCWQWQRHKLYCQMSKNLRLSCWKILNQVRNVLYGKERKDCTHAISLSKFLDIGSINNENELSLRQAVSSVSLCDVQGFTRCGCSTTGKTRCNTKRCLCKKSGLLCNSRCHPNITCSNK